MPEQLSISIPTWNRAGYLKELLASIKKNLLACNEAEIVRVYVIDNNSNDETGEVVATAGFEIIYRKNDENIGGDRNILKAYTWPQGSYVWVIGDDELVPPGALQYIMDLIDKYNPGLIINKSPEYNPFVKIPLLFEDYRKFCRFAMGHNPHLLIAHSLISANIIRRDCFEVELAVENIDYNYGPFYAIMKGLRKTKAHVLFAQQNTLIVRNIRAGSPAKDYIEQVEKNQISYLAWLKREYGLIGLEPDRVLSWHARRRFYDNLAKRPFTVMAGILYRFILTVFPSFAPRLKEFASYYRAFRYGIDRE